MKNTLILFVLFAFGNHIFAQTESKGIPVFVGYFGPYAIQPGIKIGTHFDVKEWQSGKREKIRKQSLYVSPQIGAFTQINNHTSFFSNADFGYKRQKEEAAFYSAYSIGLGYLTEFQILSSTLDLGSGEVSGKVRERRAYFLPALNYEFGKEPNSKIGWYSKFSVGRKISNKNEDSAAFIIELGLRFNLK
ncbi:MAG: hypothetical protein GY705_15250 [Bacteroidetes bacterium]|nr:hypothetical protein [Bacteroidota bacterium]